MKGKGTKTPAFRVTQHALRISCATLSPLNGRNLHAKTRRFPEGNFPAVVDTHVPRGGVYLRERRVNHPRDECEIDLSRRVFPINFRGAMRVADNVGPRLRARGRECWNSTVMDMNIAALEQTGGWYRRIRVAISLWDCWI